MEVPRPTSRLEIMAAMRRIRVSIHLDHGEHLYYIPAHTHNKQSELLYVDLCLCEFFCQCPDNDSLSLLVRVQGQGDQEEESDTGGLGGWGESHIT